MTGLTPWAASLLVAASALIYACGGSPAPEVTPPVATNLSEEEAIQIATNRAGLLIQDSTPQQIKAELTPPGTTPVWSVTFKGMFYEPSGPLAPPPATPRPREPVCSEIVVFIRDSTGEPRTLTFRDADSCS